MTTNKIAVYPGSFDPITNGHIDLIHRAAKIFDTIIIGIAKNPKKNPFLSIDDRITAAKQSLSQVKNTKVLGFDTLLVDFVAAQNAQIIIRGIRAVSDFEYEFQLAGMNKHLNNQIETIFMTPAEKYANISSSLIREILTLGGNITPFVPKPAQIILQKTLKTTSTF